jgi:hypothetical protein
VFEGQGGSGSGGGGGGGGMGSNKKIIKSTGSNIFLKQSRLEFSKQLTNFLRSFLLPACLIARGSVKFVYLLVYQYSDLTSSINGE